MFILALKSRNFQNKHWIIAHFFPVFGQLLAYSYQRQVVLSSLQNKIQFLYVLSNDFYA